MSSKDFNKEFNDLTTKFLFLNCNKRGLNLSQLGEISILLNDLNSLDYEKNKLVDFKAALRLLESILNIPSTEEILIMKACCLMPALVNKQKLCLPENQFEATIEWLIKCLNIKDPGTASDILSVVSILFKNQQSKAYLFKYFQKLLPPDGVLINLLNSTISNKSKDFDGSNEEILANVLACIDSLLIYVTDDNIIISDADSEIISYIGSKIISLMYNNKIFIKDSSQCMSYLFSALNILQKIAVVEPEWCERNVGDLLGIAKEFLHYGISEVCSLRPQKVLPSQQPIVESHSVGANYKGGKMPKTRKPRSVIKNKKQDAKAKDRRTNDRFEDKNNKYSAFPEKIEGAVAFNKTSDSDFSETESGRIQSEKHRQAKVRLNSISLLGAIIKNVDKKVFFGYWHCLLPLEEETSKNLDSYGVFTSAIKDPNPKCRLSALQVISLLLYGSKLFLMQGENSEKGPTSFTPFSVTLGNTIISMFKILTHATQNESSLPVLTQVLKCLAVLIQATPFSRLKNGFVTECIYYTRALIYHKDPTIQVAALMVMEFFVSTTEITSEISECIELPRSHTKIMKNENKLNDLGADEIIENEYYDEIDQYDNEILLNGEVETTNNIETSNKLPWLLEKIFNNLIINSSDNAKKTMITLSPVPVRIECLKVLTALASHILFIKDHLELVSNALKNSLQDEQNEIRLHAAKCLDTLGHSINTFLLSNSSQTEVTNCQNFWMSVLPFVIEKIQDSKQSPSLKSILCDFLSNIGVHIFERSSHSYQMSLISLLTGVSCNEESTVRASAVRALAVFVLFPSLRDDICFVENTATFIVELLKEKNSYVRIKASWSLGNISDALIPLSNESKLDRMSDDLLQRMFEISINLISDNDKVKCNAVRTIGNLLRLIRTEQIASIQWRSLCLRAIESLTNCLTKGGNAKVKWNVCYALGNFMKNNVLFTNYDDFNWQNTVFPSLCDIIINSPNFKVRINGVTALTVINNRNRYGQHFMQIWSSLLSSVEQSDNLVDFSEYKHRDNLQEQLCIALCHMIKIATKDDFIQMKINLINMELIKQTWKRVINRIVPENATNLINCPLYLSSLLKRNGELNAEQSDSVISLMECFVSSDENV